jgi:C4-dicarboxylate transporter DctQ subunit
MSDRSAGPIVLLRGFDGLYGKLENGLNIVAAGAVFILMFVAVAQVFARNVLGTAIAGYIDIIEQSSAIVAFFGIAYCQRLGAHMRMDAMLGGLSLRAQWALELFGSAVALVIVTLLIDGTFEHFLRAYTLGDSTIDIQLPVWPTKLIVTLALSILWLRLLLQMAGYLRLVWRPHAVPVAVPRHETVEDQVAAEIKGALGREAP